MKLRNGKTDGGGHRPSKRIVIYKIAQNLPAVNH